MTFSKRFGTIGFVSYSDFGLIRLLMQLLAKTEGRNESSRSSFMPHAGKLLGYSLLFLAMLAGCREDSGTVSVEGTVLYKGQPLASGAIAFYPVSGRPVMAPLSEDGKYEAELAPGDYAVTVNAASGLPPNFKEGDPVPPPKLVLPPEYSTRAKSTLTAKIGMDQDQPVDFKLD